MKRVKLFEQFINESTTDGTIESLIDVTKLSMQMGIFNDELLHDVREDFINGVEGSLKSAIGKLNSVQKKEFNMYAEAMMGPLRKVKTMAQFLSALGAIASAKDNILSRMELQEALNEGKISDWLKKAKTATAEWWERNKSSIISTIIEILVQFVLNILFAVLNALLKTDDIETPKFKFGGGKFGGGGARGTW